jgi:hypothetical protein
MSSFTPLLSSFERDEDIPQTKMALDLDLDLIETHS